MAAIITCHVSGVSFDYDAVPATPFRFVPGTTLPLDTAAVDFYYPAPSMSDPRASEKTTAREQALADVAIYKTAADAARK